MFWAEKSVFGLKNVWVEKKDTRELKRKERQEEKETKGGSAETEKGRKQKKKENSDAEAERKRGLEHRIFQHLFSFKSSQKNYGEFVYVGFNF